ncbi:MAG: hypothetical protein CMH56_02180 [Myxococcales bacterium]|nr:hypothetical protein [Myxococcales bacterium]|tara:strand:+ start:3019 stop:5871 length:2853 start_codon:yes stop_codon:yes gene_type:complete
MNFSFKSFGLSLLLSFLFLQPTGCGLFVDRSIEETPVAEQDDQEDNQEPEDEVGTLTLNPTEISGYPGDLLRVHAMANFADENKDAEEITAASEWRISNDEVAVIDSPGVILGVAPGQAVVTVTYGEQTQTAAVEIVNFSAGLVSLTVDPAEVEVPVDFSTEIKAMGLYENGEARNLTGDVQWNIADETVAQIDTSDLGIYSVRGVASGETTLTATYNEQTATAEIIVNAKGLLEIEIVPSTLALPVGVETQLSALGLFDDGSILDITPSVNWASLDAARASVNNEEGFKGRVTAVAEGAVAITATDADDEIQGTAELTVTPAEIESLTILPALPVMPLGATIEVQADVVMSGGLALEVTWEGSWEIEDEGIAVMRPMEDGRMLIEGISPGQTSLSHTFGDTTQSVTLEVTNAELVTLEMWPETFTMPLGTYQAFYAFGTYTDNSRAGLTAMATWTSSDPSIAFVSSTPDPGVVSALTSGTVTISAEVGNLSISAEVEVTDAEIIGVQMHPPVLALPAGDDGALRAYAVYANNTIREVTQEAAWSVADVAVAVVSNAEGHRGEISALEAGETTVSATFENFSDQSTLIITDAPLQSIFIVPFEGLETAPNRDEWLTAIGMYENGSTRVVTDRVTWSSSDTTLAQISNIEGSQGRLTALAPGELTVKAELDGREAQTTVTIADSAMTGMGVWPTETTVTVGLGVDVNAYGIFSEEGLENWLTWEAVWSSSDASIATVGNWPVDPGRITGITPGSAVVTASVGDFSADVFVTVKDREIVAIEIGPENPVVPPDRIQEFIAIATFDDDSTLDVTDDTTFTSSDSTVAAVIDAYPGIVSTASPGEVTITGTIGEISGTTTLTVQAVDPESILVSPISPVLGLGGPHQFYATALYEDNISSDVTDLCTWTSSNTSVLLVFDEGGAKGRAYGIQAGTSTVTAECLGFTTETSATVH